MQINTKLKQSTLFSSFLVAMLATSVSSAAFMDGCYVSGNAAANWLKTQTYRVRDQSAPSGTTVDLRSNSGWGGGLAIGSESGPYRLEAAADFLSNPVKNATAYLPGGFPSVAQLSTSGWVKATTLLVNGYYDFKPQKSWTPYLGLGLGVANIHPNLSAFEPVSQLSPSLHDNSTEFAYEGIAGFSWRVAKRVKANIDYRYLRTSTATFEVSDNTPSSGGGGGGGFEGKGEGGGGSSASSPTIAKARYASSRVVGGLAYYFD